MLLKKNDKNVISYVYIFISYIFLKMDLKLLYKVASDKYDPNKSQKTPKSNCLLWEDFV